MGSITVQVKGFNVQFSWCSKSKVNYLRFCPRCSNRLNSKGKWSYDDSRSYIICGRCGERFLYDDQTSDDYYDEVRRIEMALESQLQYCEELNRKEALAAVAKARISVSAQGRSQTI